MFFDINPAYFLVGGILIGVVIMLIMVPIIERIVRKDKAEKEEK